MRTNPLGSFVARDTPLSAIDARVKLVLLLAATVTVFASTNLLVLMAWYALLALAIRLSRMDVASVARSVRPVAIILAFTLAANLFVLDGRGDVAIAGPFGINIAGGIRGACAVLRIVLLAGLACTVSASTTPPELADGCMRLMRPLGRLGVPVGDIGLVLSLALRFIPIVSEEYRRIQLAQRSRGVRFDEGTLTQRIRVWASVLTPLVVGLFRRADNLANSMSARCYSDGAGSTVAPRQLTGRDAVALFAGLAIIAALFAVSLVLG